MRSDLRLSFFGFAPSDVFERPDFFSLFTDASAMSVWFVPALTTSTLLGGRKRKAALGIFSALSRRATMNETLAVIPGLSFRFALLAPMMVS